MENSYQRILAMFRKIIETIKRILIENRNKEGE